MTHFDESSRWMGWSKIEFSHRLKAVQNCRHWTDGNLLAAILPDIDQLTDDQRMLWYLLYNENGEVNGSFGFDGSKPRLYGDGLLTHRQRLNGRKYKQLPCGNIKVVGA